MVQGPPPGERPRPRRRRVQRVRDAAIGTERRIGLWLLPLFLLTGLLGATLAGGLVALYYSQQVAQLRESTEGARAQLDEAVERVDATVEEATTQIEDQVRRFREQLAQGLPVDSPNDVGVYAVSARHQGGEVRVASAFTVFSNEQTTFLVTSFALVEETDGFAADRVDVYLPNQSVVGRVHSFDRDLDIAVVVLGGGPLPVLDWRAPDEVVTRGDGVYLVGVGGPGTATVAEGRVAAVSQEALVPTVPVNSFTAGGPLLDANAGVVAIAVLRYAPFGPSEGGLTYAVPIRRLCERLIRCTRADVGAEDLGEGGEAPRVRPLPEATTEPGATAEDPTPTPTPTPLEDGQQQSQQPPPQQQPTPDPGS